MKHTGMKLRGSQTMRNGAETVTISFWATDTYQPRCMVETANSNINKGTEEREFDNFDAGRRYYQGMVGALYCDGWR